jgi:ABC-type phosphate/phosphonate transport system substrate-binding protein
MVSVKTLSQQCRHGWVLGACALTAFLVLPAAVVIGQQKVDVLRIGTSGTLTAEGESKEKQSVESLKSFIKDETGLNNEILRQKNWRELADKMAKGQLQLGVFQGYEFAWAQAKHPRLQPLALAVNIYRYPVVYVVVNRDNSAKDFAGLQGQSLALPATAQRYVRLFVDRQSQAKGKTAKTFFSKVVSRDNAEDALDDVVDGVVQATAVDRATLEAFKQRKPGRFNRLRPVAHSQPLPPTVIAYYGTVLDQATRRRFLDGLLNAVNKEKGRTMLTLFRLTGFEKPPADFERVLAETRKAYPPAAGNKTK